MSRVLKSADHSISKDRGCLLELRESVDGGSHKNCPSLKALKQMGGQSSYWMSTFFVIEYRRNIKQGLADPC